MEHVAVSFGELGEPVGFVVVAHVEMSKRLVEDEGKKSQRENGAVSSVVAE